MGREWVLVEGEGSLEEKRKKGERSWEAADLPSLKTGLSYVEEGGLC